MSHSETTENFDTEHINCITSKILGAGIEVHRTLGPGFVENIYHKALCKEFELRGIKYEQEKIIHVHYKDKFLGEQRIDFLVDQEVIVELKAVDKIGQVHVAQLISYLKTLKKKIGLILNFADSKLGIKRVII